MTPRGHAGAGLLAAAAVAALGVAGCGSGRKPLPAACADGPAAIAAGLRHAPGPVALRSGVLLSQCVERARDQGELQDVGLAMTATVNTLVGQASGSDAAALELGFLVGAARRGAARTNGVAAELVRRLERDLGSVPPRHRPALRRGLALGGARG